MKYEVYFGEMAVSVRRIGGTNCIGEATRWAMSAATGRDGGDIDKAADVYIVTSDADVMFFKCEGVYVRTKKWLDAYYCQVIWRIE